MFMAQRPAEEAVLDVSACLLVVHVAVMHYNALWRDSTTTSTTTTSSSSTASWWRGGMSRSSPHVLLLARAAALHVLLLYTCKQGV